MGILSSIFEKRSSSNLSTPSNWLVDLFGGGKTATGLYVNEQSAMQLSVVFSCVRVLSGTLASLPLIVYKRGKDGSRQRATKHPVYKLLQKSPNPRMVAFTFKQTIMGHLVTWGNSYSEIVRNRGSGVPEAIYPLRPDRVRLEVNEITQEIRYFYTAGGNEREILTENMLHIPGLGFDGIRGYSVIRMAREDIALSQATREYGARFFSNGRPRGIFKHPNALSEPAYQRLKKDLSDEFEGLDSSHKMKILEEGMEYQQIGLPPEDSQFLETRKYQRSELAGLFGVPPHMIGDLERATFSNIEHQGIDYLTYTLQPWMAVIEQVVAWKLLLMSDDYYAEFLAEALLRADSQSRAEYYNKMFQIGTYSSNDIRRKENESPAEGGDTYYVMANLRPTDQPYAPQKSNDPPLKTEGG